MRKPEDRNEYQVQNQQPVQGQVVGSGNIVKNIFNIFYNFISHSPTTQNPLEADSASNVVPALLTLTVAIAIIVIFFLVASSLR